MNEYLNTPFIITLSLESTATTPQQVQGKLKSMMVLKYLLYLLHWHINLICSVHLAYNPALFFFS